MEEKKTEGLLLQALPYLGVQRILKVLTPQEGLVTLMSKKKSLLSFTNPFLIAEWVYKTGKKEIHALQDATLINDLQELRTSYEKISIAGTLAQDLLKSQCPEKPGSGPYTLTLAYLKKLTSSNAESLLASFRLKLLLHDGHLNLEDHCHQCFKPIFSIGSGGNYCREHSDPYAIAFSMQEWRLLQQLASSRQFQVIETLKVEKTTQDKIRQLFYLLK